jgi:hypothetical protein
MNWQDYFRLEIMAATPQEWCIWASLYSNNGEMLTTLALHQERDIRASVAFNPDTDYDTILRLAEDADSIVRTHTLSHAALPMWKLESMTHDPERIVAMHAIVRFERRTRINTIGGTDR